MAYTLRDIIKQRTGEIASTIEYPTIYKFREEDEWVESNDIVRIGIRGIYISDQKNVTDKLPDHCFVKQIGSKVKEVHRIAVEKGVIPPDIFKHAINVRDFRNCFVNIDPSINNFETIPENLFANCFKAYDFGGAFSYCYNLKEIPENLFANNINAENFSFCFAECKELNSIPEKLFANNTKVINFGYCFRECTSLTKVPNKLFANNLEAVNFDYCFAWCKNILNIPLDLFDNFNDIDQLYLTGTFINDENEEISNYQEFLDKYDLTK